MSGQTALTVSQALGLAKGALEQLSVTIVGEISEFSDKQGYKAVYFTITDASSSLSCLIWRTVFQKTDIQLAQGMLVEITGAFTVYAAKGRMNFIARSIRPAGEGDMRIKVAERARRLAAEGLMNSERKLPIPPLPSTVALITSPRGKAVHDVLRTLRRRFALAQVQLFGVAVEGEASIEAILAALHAAQSSKADVILLVRGGGSYEDLMPFNDERLARSIAASRVPVITGIGHEPDTTIADMVSSFRASTPTAAAEKAVPSKLELTSRLTAQAFGMYTSMQKRLTQAAYTLESLRSRPLFISDTVLFSEAIQDLEQTASRLATAIPAALATDAARLAQAQQQMNHIGKTLTAPFATYMSVFAAQLDSLSPLAVLARGYALVYDAQAAIISSIDAVDVGERLTVRVADGSIDCSVEEKQHAQLLKRDTHEN